MRRVVPGLSIVAFAAVCACATVPPPPPAVLTFAGRDCGEALDLAQAQSLTPEKERALYSVTTQIGSATPCIRRDGRDTAYVLYAIPADAGDKTLTVGGYLEPLRILSPLVAILDAQGEILRSFQPGEFLYRGPTYSVLLRPRPGELYVLVTVDESRVGRAYDSIVIGTSTTTAAVPVTSALAAGLVGGGTIVSGVEVGLSRTFSYEGAAQVIVHDSDTREEAPPEPAAAPPS